ncbi:MAG: rod shape-determining protein MreC [Weeksellaceae bacterium]|nr:rod shape-determining protein MreC [Weeksellaceae bacterium]
MQFILKPIAKNGLFLFYVLLSLIAFVFIFRHKVYHKSIWDKNSTQFTGYVDEKIAYATEFFNLNITNRELQQENSELRREIELLKGERAEKDSLSPIISNLSFHQTYRFLPAEVVNNSIMGTYNMLTINKGSRHGVEKGMGVISPNGVIGYVLNTSENYSRVMSTLNKNTRVTAQIKRNPYFGTLIWDGIDPRYAQLKEIPKYIEVSVGDTIETDGKSGVIPGGITIGTVSKFKVDEISGELDIQVQLKEDFGQLRYAQVVMNLDSKELSGLEKSDSIIHHAKP